MIFARSLVASLLAAAVALPVGFVPARALDQREIGTGELLPILPTYRKTIGSWADAFYSDKRAVRGAMLSDPVMIRDDSGRLLWLVCLQATNAAPYARHGADRHAFGFAPGFFSAPQERRGTTLTREDCDERPLTWRPFTTVEARAKRR